MSNNVEEFMCEECGYVSDNDKEFFVRPNGKSPLCSRCAYRIYDRK